MYDQQDIKVCLFVSHWLYIRQALDEIYGMSQFMVVS